MDVAQPSSRFRAALWTTLWLSGLLIALTIGAVSAYLVLSAFYFGSKAYARLAPGDAESPEA